MLVSLVCFRLVAYRCPGCFITFLRPGCSILASVESFFVVLCLVAVYLLGCVVVSTLDILSVGIVSIMLGYVFHASELEEEPSYVSCMAWYNCLRRCRPSCHSDRKPESLGNASEMEEDPSYLSFMSARCNCLCLCRPSRHCDRKQPHRYCN